MPLRRRWPAVLLLVCSTAPLRFYVTHHHDRHSSVDVSGIFDDHCWGFRGVKHLLHAQSPKLSANLQQRNQRALIAGYWYARQHRAGYLGRWRERVSNLPLCAWARRLFRPVCWCCGRWLPGAGIGRWRRWNFVKIRVECAHTKHVANTCVC